MHARFDQDGDRNLSPTGWQRAVQAAREAVQRQHQRIRHEPARHQLGTQPRGRLYLISNLDPQKLGLTYGRLAWLHLGSTLGALLGMGRALRVPG